MPYSTTTQLPDSVKDTLPQHAQHIYKEAFNSAWEEYKNPDERKSGGSREETAHRVAWGAVKTKYVKEESGHWRSKE